MSYTPNRPVIIALIFTLLYLVFSAGSVAITKSRSSRLRELAARKFPGAVYARVVLGRADKLLMVCHTGLFLSTLLAGFWLAEFLARLSIKTLAASLPFSPTIASLVVTLFVGSIFCLVCVAMVQVARGVALARPNRTLCLLSRILLFFSGVFGPLIEAIKEIVNWMLAKLGFSIQSERELAISPEEINEIVDHSAKAGQVEEDEREMIRHVFSFSDTVVREVMTPRARVIFANEEASAEELTRRFIDDKISRILIVGENIDNVRGVLLAKELLSLVGKPSQQFDVRNYLRPAFFVPSTKKVDQLLVEFRERRVHFAVVLDEHGSVDGVVTLEDLVEEIVGEIFDEYDSPHEDLAVLSSHRGEILVDGSMLIDDINTTFHLHLPTGPYDTVAGLVLHQLGRVPGVDETFECNGVKLVVGKVEGTRIAEIRIIAGNLRGEMTRAIG